MNDAPQTPLIDAFSEEFALNAASHYDVLRAKCPISWQPSSKAWLLTRYADVTQVLRDSSLSHAGLLGPWNRLKDKYGRDFSATRKIISYMPFIYEGSKHAEMRRCFATALAPFADLSARFARRSVTMLDAVRRDGGFDLAEQFGNRLAFEIICDLAEIDEGHRPFLQPLSRLSWALESTISMRQREYVDATLTQSHGFLVEQLAGQLSSSSDSLLCALYRALPEYWEDREAGAAALLCVLVLMGNDAIGGTITFGVRWLLDESDRGNERLPQKNWDQVSDDMLRQTAVVDFLTRVASKEVRLGDLTLPPGSRVMASLLSSDHDTDQFGPDAGAISPHHKYGAGLAFGAGRHLCLGMQLARKIVHAGLGALAELPPMRSAGPTKQAAGKIVRTLSSVPVSLE